MKASKVMAMTVPAVLIALLGVWIAAGYLPVRHIETPPYQVIRSGRGYEIRQYESRILAEVRVSGEYRSAINDGFRNVAGYIFGDNTASDSIAMTAPVLHEKQAAAQKIAMTAPVLHEKDADTDVYTVAFVMPGAYTLDSLPTPNNPDVVLREAPPARFAVLRFRGFAREKTIERRTKRLLALLERDNIVVTGASTVAQYHPPWTPPFMRRNEILAPVE